MSEGTIYNNIVEVLPQVLADIPDAIGRRQKTTPKKAVNTHASTGSNGGTVINIVTAIALIVGVLLGKKAI